MFVIIRLKKVKLYPLVLLTTLLYGFILPNLEASSPPIDNDNNDELCRANPSKAMPVNSEESANVSVNHAPQKLILETEKTQQELQVAADAGDVEAMASLGLLLVKDINGSSGEGIKWLSKAVCAGNIGAMNSLGAMLINSKCCDDSSDNKEEGIKLLRKAADAGYADAKINLGVSLVGSIGCDDSSKNKKEGIKLLREAADSGDIRAKVELGCCLVESIGCDDNSKNKKEGIKLLREATNAGDIRAMYELGCYLVESIGCDDNSKNKEEGFKLLREAADTGEVMAKTNLGCCLVWSKGCDDNSENKKEGVKLLREAADAGCSPANANLGFCLVNGEGCEDSPKNKEEGISWLQKAAAKGDSAASLHLGYLYFDGKIVNKDHGKALTYFLECDRKGYCTARLIGFIYFKGKDYKNALEFYRKARDQGEDIAEAVIEYLTSKTTKVVRKKDKQNNRKVGAKIIEERIGAEYKAIVADCKNLRAKIHDLGLLQKKYETASSKDFILEKEESALEQQYKAFQEEYRSKQVPADKQDCLDLFRAYLEGMTSLILEETERLYAMNHLERLEKALEDERRGTVLDSFDVSSNISEAREARRIAKFNARLVEEQKKEKAHKKNTRKKKKKKNKNKNVVPAVGSGEQVIEDEAPSNPIEIIGIGVIESHQQGFVHEVKRALATASNRGEVLDHLNGLQKDTNLEKLNGKKIIVSGVTVTVGPDEQAFSLRINDQYRVVFVLGDNDCPVKDGKIYVGDYH